MKGGFVKRHFIIMSLCVFIAAGLGLLPVVMVKLTQALVDGVAPGQNAAGFGVFILCIFLVKLSGNFLRYLQEMCNLAISHATEIEVGEAFLNLCRGLDLASFERPDIYDRISRLRNNIRYLYLWGVGGIGVLCTSVISVVGIFLILASAGWKVFFVSLAALLPIWALHIRLTFLENKGWTDNFNRVRRQQYFSDVIHTREYLKETRTFNSFGFFGGRWEKAYDEYNRGLIRLTVTTRGASAAAAFLTAAGIGMVVWILVPLVGQGAVTLGFLVSVVEGLQQMGGDFNWTINGAVRDLLRTRQLLRDLKILNANAAVQGAVPEGNEIDCEGKTNY